MMESAIAPHLQCPRTQQRRVADDYTPPFPAWTARASHPGQTVVLALLGVQARGDVAGRAACQGLRRIVASLPRQGEVVHYDIAHHTDESGYLNMIALTYWRDAAAYDAWAGAPENDTWWRDPERLLGNVGWFREVMLPSEDRYETIFSSRDRLEAGGVGLGQYSGDVMEHGYWGSMRERLPLSQQDALAATGRPTLLDGAPGAGSRVRVAGHANLAMIRSGQDWSDTTDEERRLYCTDIEPVLRTGMDFLRDVGMRVGCYTNRYMQHVDAAGRPIEKTFGISYWQSLRALEQWAESHPTHVAIFGTFMRVVQALNFSLKLRLYHEVAVLTSGQQRYEYVNCHARTGILNGLAAASGS